MREPTFLPDFTDAAAVYERVSVHLSAGVADPAHPFHWPAVATAPCHVRTVVLRTFEAAPRTLTFHTDSRAAKVAQIRANPTMTLHFYDPVARFQVLWQGHATLHHRDAIAEAAWARLTDAGRSAYGAAEPPGTVVPANAAVTAPAPVPVSDGRAFGHLTVVVCVAETLELLELHSAGNRRARLSWLGGAAELTRLAP